MKINRAFIRTFLLYGVIGAFSAGIDIGVFAFLYKLLHVNEFIANGISIHCGILISFFLNSRYNFRQTDHILVRFFSFYLTGLFGLALSYAILWFGGWMGIDILLTKFVSIVFVAVVQFFINRVVAFRERPAQSQR